MLISDSFSRAAHMLIQGDAALYEIISLSLRVSSLATLLALMVGVPLGAFLAIKPFAGRQVIVIVLNSLLSLPPVVAGLTVYLLISKAGPFGWLSLLYSPTAMILAQFVLVMPISAALSRQIFEQMLAEYQPLFLSLNLPLSRQIFALIQDARLMLITIALACFGRAISEVGAVAIVGGNINHVTRVMTTSIVLETSKGELGFALALGAVLLAVALIVNIGAMAVRAILAKRGAHV